MKTAKILVIVALLGAATGCPKRQTSLRLVYAPPPPPTPAPASPPQVLVIESPPPPKPAEPVPERAPVESAEPVPLPQPEHHEAPSPAPQPAPEPVQTTTADAPQLQPIRSPQEQAALEQQVNGLKSGVEERIGRLSHLSLSSADRKALDDARAFLSQADQATKQGDLQEAMNFAQKADLLIAAIEKRY